MLNSEVASIVTADLAIFTKLLKKQKKANDSDSEDATDTNSFCKVLIEASKEQTIRNNSTDKRIDESLLIKPWTIYYADHVASLVASI